MDLRRVRGASLGQQSHIRWNSDRLEGKEGLIASCGMRVSHDGFSNFSLGLTPTQLDKN